MNQFLSELGRRNLGYVLDSTPFRPIAPRNSDKFANLIEHAVKNNLKVFIDPDCDPDGYFSARIIMGIFKKIGYTNYEVGRHDRKRHTLRTAYIAEVISRGFDVIIIVDSSTNSMDLINYIVDCGKMVAIIDHHNPDYQFEDYPHNAVIINPLLEDNGVGIVYNKLSAGAICALVAAYTLRTKFGIRSAMDLYLYGFITLYSDICDLSNPYNIAYIRAFQNQQLINSDIISMFMTEYSHFDRNFCSFNIVPRLNALMRMEEFEMLHTLFFETEKIESLSQFKEDIDKIYYKCKAYVEHLVSRCTVDQHKNFVIAYIPEDEDPVARNFTGLVANRVADTYNQTCLCLYSATSIDYAGSVRDPFSRDMLNVFKPLMYAAGHGAAFGIEFRKNKLDEIVMLLDTLDDMFVERQEDVIIIPWDNHTTDDVKAEMQSMAEYNEFGGQGLPKAIGVMTIGKNFKIYPGPKMTRVYGNGHKFTVFLNALAPGDTMLISPTVNGSDYQLIVNNVKYNGG